MNEPRSHGAGQDSGPCAVRFPSLFGVAGLLACLWVTGYAGLSGDAQLYALQGLTHAGATRLDADLFFAYGSQDAFSLFPRLYAPLIRALGVGDAALLVTLASLLALFTASAMLFGAWGGRWGALAAVTLTAVWPVPYAADSVLRVAQTLATPRPAAAALALAAIALWTAGRRWAALLAALGAALLHPLMAWPALAVLAILRFGALRSAGLALGGLLVLLLVVATGLPGADRLSLRIDPAWLGAVLERSPFVAPSQWTADDWSLLALGATLPALAALRLDGDPRRVLLGASALALAGVAMTAVGGDVLRLAIIYQAQPWRAIWLARWLGLGAAGVLLMRWSRTRDPLDLTAALGVLGAETALAGTGLVVMAAALAACAVARRFAGKRAARLALWGSWALSTQALGWRLLGQPAEWLTREALAPFEPVVPIPLNTPFVVLLAAIPLLLLAHRCAPRLRAGGVRILIGVSSLVVAAIVAAGVERVRDAEARELEAMRRAGPRLLAELPTDGAVFWGEDGRRGWFGLEYPVYLSIVQTAGVVFSRGTALEAQRRAAHVEGVLGTQRYTRWLDRRASGGTVAPVHVAALCTDPGLAAVFVRDPVRSPRAIVVADGRGGHVGSLLLCRD